MDTTNGSVARFVNHSCQPNSRMLKWIVNEIPRIALFAGDKPVMIGTELTIDYNSDHFPAAKTQECLCNSANYRGIIGSKRKGIKLVRRDNKRAVKLPVSKPALPRQFITTKQASIY